jgi:hypothetical protein
MRCIAGAMFEPAPPTSVVLIHIKPSDAAVVIKVGLRVLPRRGVLLLQHVRAALQHKFHLSFVASSIKRLLKSCTLTRTHTRALARAHALTSARAQARAQVTELGIHC